MKLRFLLLLITLLSAWQIGTAQTALLDDFTRANSNTVGNGWTETETVAAGAQIATNRLQLGSATAGREWVYRDLSANYTTDGITTSASTLTWAFNFRHTRTDPSGFDASNYGAAFILGATTTTITTGAGNGYAVVVGQSGATDPIRLVRFTTGLNASADATNIISGGDYGTDYFSVRVTFDPANDQWSLYVETNAVAFPQADPRNTATQIGVATIDATYTAVGSNLRYMGPFWNHATGATDNAVFDDIYAPNISAPATCAISAITVANATACNNAGTIPNATDDYFTGDVTVTFANKPATGNLVLTGDVTGGPYTVAVGSTTTGTTHTFTGVQMLADGTPVSLTAAFSDDALCTFTNATANAAVASCSAAPTVGFNSNGSGALEIAGTHTVQVSMNTAPVADVQVTITDLGTGTAATPADYTYATTVFTFTPAETYPNTKIVTLTIVNDGPLVDNNETVNLSLAITTGTATLGTAAHTVNILELEEGLIVNEFSNGPSGNKEWVEFLVVGAPGTTVDIRGWAFDDNNGNFSGGAGSQLGIASGYIAFENNCTWEKVPAGSLIVFYNADDPNPNIPAADPTDANFDFLYVIPITVDFGTCTTPAANDYFDANATSPSTTSNAYPAVTQDPCWGLIGFRNGGDAVQLLRPDRTFYQGISWGTEGATGDCAPCALTQANHPQFATYGANALYFTEAGNFTYSFTNEASSDFNNKLNWLALDASVAGNETPGVGNSVANTNFINALRGTYIPADNNSTYTCNLREFEERIYFNADDEIILYIANASATDHGPTTATVTLGGGTVTNANLTNTTVFADPTWTVEVSNEGTPSYLIRFYVTDAQLSELTTAVNTQFGTAFTIADIKPRVRVFKAPGLGLNPKTAPDNTDILIEVPAVGTYNGYTTFAANYLGFSTFVLGVPENVLPVEYLSFSANARKEDVLLTWSTAQEENNERFDIERSFNGQTYEVIGTVSGAGSSSLPQQYSFVDAQPRTGINYYRLRQVDFNGNSDLSDVEEVRFAADKQLTILAAWPNPTSGDLNLQLNMPQAGNAALTLYNIQGQAVQSQTLSLDAGIQETAITLQRLPAGLYLYRLTLNGQVVEGKIVRN
ncbi:MAG: T9SS C-terminal target domain-containing protein [Bacteroidetes bacterium]|nr:MAG: T9SS C-terminal target domain-containing protein [Bacteroidota bacterium]